MKKLLILGCLVIASTIILLKKEPHRAVDNTPTAISAPKALLPPPIKPNSINQVFKSPPDASAQAALLEREVSELNHEIEQGGYIDRINDPSTPDYIKKELKERLRLMVRKTIELTQLNIRRIDREASL